MKDRKPTLPTPPCVFASIGNSISMLQFKISKRQTYELGWSKTENGPNGFRQQTEQKRTKRCGWGAFFLVEAHLILFTMFECMGANSRPNGFRQANGAKTDQTLFSVCSNPAYERNHHATRPSRSPPCERAPCHLTPRLPALLQAPDRAGALPLPWRDF